MARSRGIYSRDAKLAQITFISQEQEQELYRDDQDLPKDGISLSDMSHGQGNQWRNSDSLLLSNQPSMDSDSIQAAGSIPLPASPYPGDRLQPNRRMPETIPEVEDLSRAERGQAKSVTSWTKIAPKKPRMSHFVHNFRSPIGMLRCLSGTLQ